MKLPVVSANKVIKALYPVGFRISRQSGSHVIMVREYGGRKTTVVIPKHQEIAKGTLLSIIAQSGMNRDDFCKLLK